MNGSVRAAATPASSSPIDPRSCIELLLGVVLTVVRTLTCDVAALGRVTGPRLSVHHE